MKTAAHTIPVIVHHETGTKNQSGGKKNQEYLRYCIEQAQKYNKKVILIGDSLNKKWCGNWHDVSEFVSERWNTFAAVFQNLSAYPDTWANSIFKRFFLIYEYLEKNGETDCVILDSDILVYTDFSAYHRFLTYDTALEIPKLQDLPGAPAGNGLRWTACAGIAYFKKEALASFLDYCIDMYTNHLDFLSKKWDAHKKYKLYGGVGEMSLLYLWTKTLPKERVLNLLDIYHDSVFDLNIGIPANYLEKEYYYDSVLRIKKLIWKDEKPYCRRQIDHKPIRFLALHFVDISKQYMYDLYTCRHITAAVRIKGMLWHIRSILAGIKHKLFG